jgi:hypothetical protein
VSFLSNLKEWGRKHKAENFGAALVVLHGEQRKTPAEIAEMFSSDSKSVRFWMDAFGVPTQLFEPKIIAAAKQVRGKKYKTLADYFRDNWGIGFSKMSKELNVSRSTVESYYKFFTEEMKELTQV